MKGDGGGRDEEKVIAKGIERKTLTNEIQHLINSLYRINSI